MDVHTNIPLKNYLTMRIGGPTRFMADATSPEELATTYQNATSRQLPVFILGGGSNTLCSDAGFDGIIIRPRIMGIETIGEDVASVTFRVGAGEIWDDIVKMTVDKNLSGMEALSAIPGTVGAAPVQNIGAYGQELQDVFVELEAYDTSTNSFVKLSAEECGFAYRHSIFRGSEEGRYIITHVILRVYKSPPGPPFYDALQKYFDEHNITTFSPQIIRDAVIAIRSDKLPDPAKRPNTGSFFKNAIIEEWQLNDLLQNYPTAPHYDFGEKRHKIPTGWLIEQTGLKGQLLHGMRVHDKNALVLINESATGYADLDAAREEIIGKVRDMFRIDIEQEPLEIR